ncbi:MAG: hypothetical protein NVSMB47_17700 [Polyangiales bacterium]
MRSRSPLFLFALATASVTLSCSSKDSPAAPGDSGGADAGAYVFQPKGCGYRVDAMEGFPDFEPSSDAVGADATPRHVRLGLGGGVDGSKPGYADPSTSFAVGWQTDVGTMASKLKFGDAADKLDTVVEGASVFLPQELRRGPDAGLRFHQAHACGLQPGRAYFYSVGGGPAGKETWSAPQQVTLAPAKGSSDAVPIAFVGDTRDSIGKPEFSVWRAISGRLQNAGARAVLFSGDAVFVGADESLWDAWTTSSDPLAGATFVAMAPGNHENELVRYFAHVVMPGTGKNAGRYSSFDVGPVHAVMLDDYDGIVAPSIDVTGYREELLAWLDADLARADANRASVPWIVTFHHHPAYDSGDKTDRVAERKAVQDALVSRFDAHHVDLDVAGHDHFYERSKPLAGGAAAGKGTTYLVCAGGGAPSYGTLDGNPLSQAITHYDPAASEGLYGLITADAKKLDVKVYKMKGATGTSPADDTVADSFTLTR